MAPAAPPDEKSLSFPEPPPPLPPSPPGHGAGRATRWIAIGAVVAVALLVLVVALNPSWWSPTASACDPVVPSAFADRATVEPCGTRTEVPADSYWVEPLERYSDDQALYGNFSSTGLVSAYLLNGSEVAALVENPHPSGPPPSDFWSCGSTSRCAVRTPIPPSPSVYSFVLENLGASNATVDWFEALLIAYSPSLPAGDSTLGPCAVR